MRTLTYQVLLTEGSQYVIAAIPDLGCEAVGSTPAAALAQVEKLAARALRPYQDAELRPPTPARLSLRRIELPAPIPVRPTCRLRLVEGLTERQPGRRDRITEASCR